VGNLEEKAQQQAELLEQLEADMLQAAAELDFERAAQIRDQIAGLRDGAPARSGRGSGGRGRRGRRQGGHSRIPKPKR
jgi:hypothetical protein